MSLSCRKMVINYSQITKPMDIPVFKLRNGDGTNLGTFYIIPSRRNDFCQMLSYYTKIHGEFLHWSDVEYLAYCCISVNSYEELMKVIKGKEDSLYQIELM